MDPIKFDPDEDDEPPGAFDWDELTDLTKWAVGEGRRDGRGWQGLATKSSRGLSHSVTGYVATYCNCGVRLLSSAGLPVRPLAGQPCIGRR
jgi:hypothetical protein